MLLRHALAPAFDPEVSDLSRIVRAGALGPPRRKNGTAPGFPEAMLYPTELRARVGILQGYSRGFKSGGPP